MDLHEKIKSSYIKLIGLGYLKFVIVSVWERKEKWK